MANKALDAELAAQLMRKLPAGVPWSLCLPRKSYSVLVVAEPAVRAEEMGESLRWAIGGMIDYPVEDTQLAWMRIPTAEFQPNRPPHLYVAATKLSQVREYEAACRTGRVSLLAVDIKETAYRNMANLIEKPGEGVALLSVGRTGVQLTVSYRGELYLDRFVEEVGFDAAAESHARERACERVVLQVQRSLDFIARTLPFIELNRVVFAPTRSGVDVLDYFRGNLAVPVELYDLPSVLDIAQAPELSAQDVQADYFAALGVALRFQGGGA